MKSEKIILSIMLFILVFPLKAICNEIQQDKLSNSEADLSTWMYVRKAVGELTIDSTSSSETYEVYFLIPVPFKEQVPLLVEIESHILLIIDLYI